MKIEEYITIEGKSPFADWFNGLDSHAANKVNVYLTRIEQGNCSNLKPINGALGITTHSGVNPHRNLIKWFIPNLLT